MHANIMVEGGRRHYRPKERQEEGEQPGSVVLHERAKAAGAYDRLPERIRPVVEAYLTTPATYEELRPLAGNVSATTVSKNIRRGIHILKQGLSTETLMELGKMNRRRPSREEG